MNRIVCYCSIALVFCCASLMRAQEPAAVLHGRTMDATGKGAAAKVEARAATDSTLLGSVISAADGLFQLPLSALPEQVIVTMHLSGVAAVSRTIDSTSVRRSAQVAIILRASAAQTLAQVQVKAKAQKRASVFRYFEGEASTRTEQMSASTTQWLDPFQIGAASSYFNFTPEMMLNANGSASFMGAGAGSNQIQLGGATIPSSFVAGGIGGTLSTSPWDVTVGGSAGANLNLFINTGGAFSRQYAVVQTGASGTPPWLSTTGTTPQYSLPAQVTIGSSGPLGKVRYNLSGFASRQTGGSVPWERQLSPWAVGYLNVLSENLDAPTTSTNSSTTNLGLLGRVDFAPGNTKRVDALTLGVSTTREDPGGSLLFQSPTTALLGVVSSALAQMEDTRIWRDRVLFSSQATATLTQTSATARYHGAGISILDAETGMSFLAGGSANAPDRNNFSAEARSSATWYSVDNSRRYVAQIQGRFARSGLGAAAAHGVFDGVLDDLLTSPGVEPMLLGYSYKSAASASNAYTALLAPAMSVRQELGRNAAVLLGVRADAWQLSAGSASGGGTGASVGAGPSTGAGLSATPDFSGIDVSPRLSLISRIPSSVPGKDPKATIRAGIGRFVNWMNASQLESVWAGTSSQGSCVAPSIPVYQAGVDGALCPNEAQAQIFGRVVAGSNMAPSSATRADVSVGFKSPIPNFRMEIGAAYSHNSRLWVLKSPLVGASVADRLAGEANRAMLVSASSISSAGVVPLVQTAGGAGTLQASTLSPEGWSNASQLRLRLATQDPFATVQFDIRYVYTQGREHSRVLADAENGLIVPTTSLSAAGRHSIAASAGWWIGDVQFRATTLLRSGIPFTPLADRDVNGDGLINDAAYVPAQSAKQWAAQAPGYLRSCIMRNTGKVAGFNSCEGPWNLQSMMSVSYTGAFMGLPRNTDVSLQLWNLAGLVSAPRDGAAFVAGNASVVNPLLQHVTGFDASSARFVSTMANGFGKLAGGGGGGAGGYAGSTPVRLAVSVRVPLGRSITAQRSELFLNSVAKDTSAAGYFNAMQGFLEDVPPLPIIVLQSAQSAQLTAEQRSALQAMMGRWQMSMEKAALQLRGQTLGTSAEKREKLSQARAMFFEDVQAMAAEIRTLLSADQVELLPESVVSWLNPRFLRFVARADASG